jgi:polyisoprenoid-binding protein YceI
MLLVLLAALPLAQAEVFTFASDPTAPAALTFHNSSTLGDFQGAAGFTGQLDTRALKGVLTVPAAGLVTGNGPRDTRLRSFCLEVARFANIVFQVTGVTGDAATLQSGAGSGTVSLQGALTVRDVTRTVTVPASFSYDGAVLHLAGRYDLRWADFGVPDPSVVMSTLAPDMYVAFDLTSTAAPTP